MSNPPRSILVRTEYLLIAIFFVLFSVWSISKCGRKKDEYTMPTNNNNSTVQPTAAAPARDTLRRPLPPPPTAAAPARKENTPSIANPVATTPKAVAPKAKTPAATPPTEAEKYTKLYVAVDGLKIRKKPNQKAGILGKLRLDEELSFLGDRSKTNEKITMSDGSVANQPWVWIKTKRGTVGWVYGGGVRYYK